MKQALLIIFSLFAFSFLQAQDLSFEYLDTDGTMIFEMTGDEGQDVVIKGELTNETDEALNLTWFREVVYIYSENENMEWLSAVCDINQCYFPHVSTADFTIDPNGTSNLDAHVYPKGFQGDSAIILIHVVNNETNDTLTVDYRFYDDIALSSSQAPKVETLVFPNPAASYFRIQSDQNITSVEIFDIVGKQVAEHSAQGTEATINISYLSRGMYIVRIRGEQGQVIKTQRLKKDML
jgi:hypothetical protein